VTAFWLRTHELARRPMHADEANQAVKLGELIDAGRYAFDPRDHHGPTLYYAALPIAWLRGEHSLSQLTETTVRLVPAIFGTIAVGVLVLLAAPLGRWPALAAGAFLAVSPPAVYYSRYFIQETLLVAFTLAAFTCARAWWRSGLMRWAAATGVCVGLMQGTKASAPLFIVAALVALFVARMISRDSPANTPDAARNPFLAPAILTVLAAFATAALLYSSFGTNPGGVGDAVAAYTNAFSRFGADAAPTGHEKPWWYYLRLLGWFREGGLVWHQVAFSTLAAGGVIVALVRRDAFLRGVAIYALAITAVFSLFAYKTPWHAVHLVPGFALLAAAALAALAHGLVGRVAGAFLALLVIATQLQQTRLVAFQRPADRRNPYAYVHSSADVLKYRPLAQAAVARTPDQPVRVISEEYWPLPWYLRGLPRVGFYSTPPDDCDGALVITSSTQADAVRSRLRGTYRESFLGLRPGFICVIFTPEP
jgi:uncharacterized protein (TIGR03663 family)